MLMDERQRNVAVGLTAAVGLGGLILLLMLFGWVPGWLEGGYVVTVEMRHAGGIHEGSRVQLNGIDVGEVKSVELVQPTNHGVKAVVQIADELRLPQNVKVEISGPLFGGGSTMHFVTQDGHGEPMEFLPMDGSAVVQGEISSPLGSALAGPMSQINRLADSFETLSSEWTAVGKNLNELVQPRGPEAVDAGEAAGNLSSVIARVDTRLAELKEVLEGIDRYVNDEKLHEDVTVTAAKVRQLSETVGGSVEAVRDRYVAVADDIAGAVASMRKLVDQTRQGEGTVGKFMTDPALYNNLNDAAQRLQVALDEMRLLVAKWKAEGLPVQF
jgi:ABC-type transporter Mla subunit MlaD